MVEALWLLYSYYDTTGLNIGCPPGGISSCYGGLNIVPTHLMWTLALALILIAAGALGAWGVSVAYLGGSALSAIALLLTGYTVAITRSYGYLSAATDDAILGFAFALVALIVNLQAMRAKGGLSEQANPMNLPVFG